ncbi:hypothetical protein [Alcanivorax sp. NBRC 102024]|uniref:hypothetical protein n=1 Tax=Alcanivorax sp. NBRC 102024 TaxID=1113895 RepID=UPI000789CEB6|nr:hypothetical protein [Alcanivorax sp. NBRC 102024]
MGDPRYRASRKEEWETVPSYFDSEENRRFLEAEGELMLRWERLKHAREGIGNLHPDRLHSRPSATQVLAADLLVAEVDAFKTAAEEYRDATRERKNGS